MEQVKETTQIDLTVGQLRVGDRLLGSGATVLRAPTAGARTPSGKVEVVVQRRTDGGARLATWGRRTTMRVERDLPVWDVDVFSATHRWLRRERVAALSLDAAAHAVGIPLFRYRQPGDLYCHVDPVMHRPSDGTCERCGSRRSACGGESNPHE